MLCGHGFGLRLSQQRLANIFGQGATFNQPTDQLTMALSLTGASHFEACAWTASVVMATAATTARASVLRVS
jgi:hypothetical protein